MKSKEIIGILLGILGFMYFAVTTFNSNQEFLDEVVGSVSGTVESIVVCKISSFEISKECVDVTSKQNFIRRLKGAKKALSLSHAQSVSKLMMKITSTESDKKQKIACFIVDEYAEAKDLYLSRIDSGRNCSNAFFRYLSGVVKIQP